MRDRMSVACVLLAAAVAGLFFAPVFGVAALFLPIGVPVVLVFGATELCARRESWRPLVLIVAGLVGITETVLFPTTLAGLPTGETVAALASGVTESWQQTLQSTWPARPDPSLLLFVPLLVLLASVFGIELLRLRRPLLALVPSFAVVVVSQLYVALSGTAAVLAALGYAAVAGTLFALTRSAATGDERPDTKARQTLHTAVPAVVLGLAGAVVAGLLVPAPGPAYSLKQDQVAPLTARVANPLHEIANRLKHPDTAVFDIRGPAGADRWPLVVLDTFDGVNWTPGGHYRRLGTELPPNPAVTVPSQRRTAEISTRNLEGAWLPSQTWPAAVTGLDPLVEESQGTLVVPNARTTEYTLSWWEPQIGAVADLVGAAIDPKAQGGLGDVGAAPAGVGELARQAVHGTRPSFQAALALERFLNQNYRLATETDLPSGHSWPQLAKFLFETKRGTSEQFAAAYVALARILGIPARLVVGFRTPAEPGPGGEYTVRNGDVLAWPEVAVAGIGWVPLDPGDTANQGSATASSGLAAVTAQARAQLPAPELLQDPPVAPAAPGAAGAGDEDGSFPVGLLLIAAAALVVAWFAGVPLAKSVRSWRRRRRPGTGAVLGAWLEVRDRLREHQVPFTAGMTVRDLAAAAHGVGSQSTVDGLRALGSTVDLALWSGVEPGEHVGAEAWSAVRTVRRGLARRGLRARLKAAVDPRSLLAPRG